MFTHQLLVNVKDESGKAGLKNISRFAWMPGEDTYLYLYIYVYIQTYTLHAVHF